MTTRLGAPLVVSMAVLVTLGCSGPPWYMGRPLDGRPSIPPRTARPVPEEARAGARAARAAGRPVLEIAALSDLASIGKLSATESVRLSPDAAGATRRRPSWQAPRDVHRRLRLSPESSRCGR